MGMVAPTTAVIGAAIPVAFGLLFEGLPGIQQLAGLILAFLAVWLVSAAGRSVRVPFSNLGLPLSAGSMFGLFFILMGQVSPGTVFWPLVAARAASLSTLFLVAIFRRDIRLPVRRQVPLIALAGILDAGGNIFYTLAAQVGRLDIAAMLSSFYPASTVLLARVVLKEVISPRQWAGLSVALIAILLITS
jgi:drug/metabolite transporter (DMT)-like permease